MLTLLIQLLVSLSISSLIVLMLVRWLSKRTLKRDAAYVDSMFEIIPRDAVSHSDSISPGKRNSHIIKYERS